MQHIEIENLSRQNNILLDAISRIARSEGDPVDVAKRVLIATRIEIEPKTDPFHSHRTGTLIGVSWSEIVSVLGFTPNVQDDPNKVVNSWAFTADGDNCAIWDFKGSHEHNVWSTYGNKMIFSTLFGERYDG